MEENKLEEIEKNLPGEIQ